MEKKRGKQNKNPTSRDPLRHHTDTQLCQSQAPEASRNTIFPKLLHTFSLRSAELSKTIIKHFTSTYGSILTMGGEGHKKTKCDTALQIGKGTENTVNEFY